jgi:hypothetical protein
MYHHGRQNAVVTAGKCTSPPLETACPIICELKNFNFIYAKQFCHQSMIPDSFIVETQIQTHAMNVNNMLETEPAQSPPTSQRHDEPSDEINPEPVQKR